MKTCTGCRVEKPLTEFYVRRSGQKTPGYEARCKQCEAAAHAEYRKKNKGRLNAHARLWDLKNPERKAERDRTYRARNAEKVASTTRAYRQENKALFAHHANMYRLTKRQACPPWLDDEVKFLIAEAYDLAQRRAELCGGEWHVDHIVPVRGKSVCGLHVPWNLQVIPKEVNLRKHNHHAN